MLMAYWLDQLAGQARRLIRVTGRDAHRFMQGLITTDLRVVVPGEGRASALLTVKGKMISDAVALALGDHESNRLTDYGLAVPQPLADDIVNNLQRHAIMDDVVIAVQPEVGLVVLVGDDAPVQLAGVRTARVNHPLPGVLVFGDHEALQAACGHFTRGDAATFDHIRIEAGIPGWGHELNADVFPPEVGFVHAVSYNKGCYLGQEPLARIHARGQTNWMMVQVRSDLGPAAQPGELAAADRPHAGKVTTTSPLQADGLALAIVHRKVATVGTSLHLVERPDEIWEVVSPPLGADIRPAT